jgi:hypothetical protein
VAPSQGFIANAATVAGQTTTYAIARAVALSGSTAVDAWAKALPSGGYWSHLEVLLTETVATVASVTFFLSWDAAGNVPASSEATITLVRGLTDTTLLGGASGLDVWPSFNDNAVAGTLYLHMKTNAGTATLTQARLYWRDHHAG